VFRHGPDGPTQVGSPQNDLKEEQRKPAHGEYGEVRHADPNSGDRDGLHRVGSQDRLRVAAPDRVGEILKDEPDAEEEQEGLDRGADARAREAAHDPDIEKHSQAEEEWNDDDQREKRVEMEAV